MFESASLGTVCASHFPLRLKARDWPSVASPFTGRSVHQSLRKTPAHPWLGCSPGCQPTGLASCSASPTGPFSLSASPVASTFGGAKVDSTASPLLRLPPVPRLTGGLGTAIRQSWRIVSHSTPTSFDSDFVQPDTWVKRQTGYMGNSVGGRFDCRV